MLPKPMACRGCNKFEFVDVNRSTAETWQSNCKLVTQDGRTDQKLRTCADRVGRGERRIRPRSPGEPGPEGGEPAGAAIKEEPPA